MDQTIGFIGAGNMGGAMIGGIVGAGLVQPGQIVVSDVSPRQLERVREEYGVRTTADNAAAAAADVVFLAVKPQYYPPVIDSIRQAVGEQTVVVSIAAGQSLRHLEELFGRPVKLVRAMPNTPALVGAGMAALCPNAAVSEEEMERVRALFESFGLAERVSEEQMDAVTAVSGSSPAYVYLLIEAMADGAVAGGLPRDKAYRFAAQAVLGSAKMVLETGRHPGELKDMVCSPAGTTIDAVAKLEEKGFRAAVLAAVETCRDKSRRMTR